MGFDDLNKILHAQFDVHLLAVDEKSGDSLNADLIATLDVLQNSAPQLARTG